MERNVVPADTPGEGPAAETALRQDEPGTARTPKGTLD